MSFRFFRRVRIAPGITLNLSKRGVSVSMGPRGAKYTVGSRGTRATMGLPGTGLFYTKHKSWNAGGGRHRGTNSVPTSRNQHTPPPPTPKDKLDLGFFKRLRTPKTERAFVDGCLALSEGKESEALSHFRSAKGIPDASWMGGYIALKEKSWELAASMLQEAASHASRLGFHFEKYEIYPHLNLAITPMVKAVVAPDLRGALLGMAEAHQAMGRHDLAIADLGKLHEMDPSDLAIRLSLGELLLEAGGDDPKSLDRVVRLAEGVENESTLETAILFHKGEALRRLGLFEAARDALTTAHRRKKDRPAELLRAIAYERALVYSELGQHARARTEFSRIYAETPGYRDVARRVGVR